MVAKSLGAHSRISALFCPLPPPPPHTMLIHLEIWADALGTGVQFMLPNVLSAELNIVPGEGAIIFLYGVMY